MSDFFATQRRVEFCETDAAGIVHFSAFMIYMEQAEHEFWRSLGRSVVQKLDADSQWHLSWPRVRVECDYQGVARFEDLLQVELRVARLGKKSVSYEIDFCRGEDRIAQGKVVAVCCRVQIGEPLESIEIPPDLVAALEPYKLPVQR